MFDPEVQNPRIPGLVELGFCECGAGGFAIRPAVSTNGGGFGGAEVSFTVWEALDDGIDEDEGCEEAGVEEGEVDEVAATHAVADTDYGAAHLVAEVVDH